MYLGAAVAFYFLWLSLPPCPPLYRHPLSCSPEGLNALTLRGALYFSGGGGFMFSLEAGGWYSGAALSW